MSDTSYIGKTYVVADSDARLRDADDIMKFLTDSAGKPLTIPQGTNVSVSRVKTVPQGSRSVLLFAEANRQADGQLLGWTAASNLKGGLRSETLGRLPAPAGGSRFGAHASWQDGAYLGQIDLVQIFGSDNEIEYMAAATAPKFVELVSAAQAAGIMLTLNSGFRSYPEQKKLRDGWDRRLPGYNPANRPGHSNHQNGIAFDLSVGVGPGNPTYDWLATNATSFGFIRTVPKEVWHWEFRPTKAATAKVAGKHKSW